MPSSLCANIATALFAATQRNSASFKLSNKVLHEQSYRPRISDIVLCRWEKSFITISRALVNVTMHDANLLPTCSVFELVYQRQLNRRIALGNASYASNRGQFSLSNDMIMVDLDEHEDRLPNVNALLI
jgi:hypothetical protein